MKEPRVYPVIPAGGSGTRLWPLSRRSFPKFLQPVAGTTRSLLAETVARLASVAPVDDMYIVTGAAHAAHVARDVTQVPVDNVLVEPSPRDSAPAIALAAAVIHQRDPEGIMASFAADHVIRDVASFRSAVRNAVLGAQQGYLMTIGLTPRHPETGFGYIKLGEQLDGGPLRQVVEFKEKPDLALARQYVASGRYLWNASMFVWQTEVFLAQLAVRDADLHVGVLQIAAAWDTPNREAVLHEVWPTLPKIAVDYLIMEPAATEGKVATVPGSFDWSDVGDFNEVGLIAATSRGDQQGNVVVPGLPHTDPMPSATLGVHGASPGAEAGEPARSAPELLTHHAHNVVLVSTQNRPVAVVGLENVAVVDTDDVLLVVSRGRVQEVKRIVESLPEHHLSRLL